MSPQSCKITLNIFCSLVKIRCVISYFTKLSQNIRRNNMETSKTCKISAANLHVNKLIKCLQKWILFYMYICFCSINVWNWSIFQCYQYLRLIWNCFLFLDTLVERITQCNSKIFHNITCPNIWDMLMNILMKRIVNCWFSMRS